MKPNTRNNDTLIIFLSIKSITILVFLISIFIFSCGGDEDFPYPPPEAPQKAAEEETLEANKPSTGGFCTNSDDGKYSTNITLSRTLEGNYTFTCFSGATSYTENEEEYTTMFFSEGLKDQGKGISITYKGSSGKKNVGLFENGCNAEIVFYMTYRNGTYKSQCADNLEAEMNVINTKVEGESIIIELSDIKLKWREDSINIDSGKVVAPRIKNNITIANYLSCECKTE